MFVKKLLRNISTDASTFCLHTITLYSESANLFPDLFNCVVCVLEVFFDRHQLSQVFSSQLHRRPPQTRPHRRPKREQRGSGALGIIPMGSLT